MNRAEILLLTEDAMADLRTIFGEPFKIPKHAAVVLDDAQAGIRGPEDGRTGIVTGWWSDSGDPVWIRWDDDGSVGWRSRGRLRMRAAVTVEHEVQWVPGGVPAQIGAAS